MMNKTSPYYDRQINESFKELKKCVGQSLVDEVKRTFCFTATINDEERYEVNYFINGLNKKSQDLLSKYNYKLVHKKSGPFNIGYYGPEYDIDFFIEKV